ncbi:MAG: aldehyde dehydrogenase family protein [Alphaproteobacteria bacterium]|nr:aldehyde dehydrogenase family protein [Alphaproteobacteria bacterium]MDP6567061.1 aldehyde dehydrogenase family protein [Alphaproteobacteria bacterium]
MLDRRQYYIDGAWVAPADGRDFDVVNPATERPAATISLAGAGDVDRAVQVARRAFPDYMATTVEERLAWLQRLLDIYLARADEMTAAMTTEMGAPLTFCREVQTPCGDGHVLAFKEALRAFEFEGPSPRGGSRIVHEPIGVCALITPWNWPINQVVVKVIPALAAGCTCVLKPSEHAPLSAMLFAEMLDEAGFPPGAFNLINGDGALAGAELSRHPDVDMVSFTGSTRAGVAVSRAAADTIKRVTLELGGKSPNLLFADADLEGAVNWSVAACYSNAGQTCDAPTRLLVERPVYEDAKAIARQAALATKVGDPAKEGDHIGPVVNARQFENIQRLIQIGIDEGATLLAGGVGRPDGLEVGYYVKPTLFADVGNEMTVNREEIFGPALCMLPFDTEEEAIRLANDTPYGLGACIQTGDPARAERVARRLRAGGISINGGAPDYDAPFGGMKQSGNGRENGVHGLADYLDLKTITG